uniref:phage integrase N-terminal SAM-like domain-containing protein n=1 Tax=Sphingomonas populi TaxID=2484750 RepID=UPI001E3CF68F|nr:phage integrase N-terminal SAM-like domain-containing protein [Sphingomonas populi]
MATLPIDRPVTPLRQRMLDDMAMRTMRSRTQHDDIRHVPAFAGFLERSPDTATAADVRGFQRHQREHGVGESTINGSVSALPVRRDARATDLSRRLVLAHRPRKLPDG